MNTNYVENETNQRCVHADSDAYEEPTHSLVYFVLKYLQQIPHSIAANNMENPVLLINIFAARCLLDFFDHDEHVGRMRIFLQKQLRKIKLSWIEHIVVTKLDLGDRLPEIKVGNGAVSETMRSLTLAKGRSQALDRRAWSLVSTKDILRWQTPTDSQR
jgi:hypothetical protein